MSPELFHPKDFGLEDSRRTKCSDCYAFGMVIYEVLSGRVPFFGYDVFAVVAKVGRGERPERPQGAEGKLFTHVIWGILERCWAPRRDNRPRIEDVLQFLEEASRSWTPLSPLVEGPLVTDSPIFSLLDPSTEENTDKGEVFYLTQATPSRPSLSDDASQVSSLRHRIPHDHQHQDLTSSERLSGGRPPFVSNICSEKEVGAKARRSSNRALGGVAEEVCMFSDSLTSVTEASF